MVVMVISIMVVMVISIMVVMVMIIWHGSHGCHGCHGPHGIYGHLGHDHQDREDRQDNHDIRDRHDRKVREDRQIWHLDLTFSSSNDEIYVNVNLYCFFYQRLPTNQLISINNIIYIMIYFSPCSSFSPLNRTGNGENDGKPEQLNPLFQHFTGSEYSRPSHASRIQNKSVLIIAKIFTDCNSRAENRSWSLVALLGLLWLRSLISYEVMVLIKTLLSMPLSHMINKSFLLGYALKYQKL